MQDFNRHVAISEEFANVGPDKIKSGGLLFDRRVTRVITPGTLIDERFLDPSENNYLLAAHVHSQDPASAAANDGENASGGESADSERLLAQMVGLAWLDLSTGDFFTQSVRMSSLASSIARIVPREIILEHPSTDEAKDSLMSKLSDYRHLVTYVSPPQAASQSALVSAMEEDIVVHADYAGFSEEEVAAITILLQYAKSQLQGLKLKLQPPVRRQLPETMLIDKHSLRALEIKTTLKEGHFRGSLLHAVRRTVTSSGSRLLSNWLSTRPLCPPLPI